MCIIFVLEKNLFFLKLKFIFSKFLGMIVFLGFFLRMIAFFSKSGDFLGLFLDFLIF